MMEIKIVLRSRRLWLKFQIDSIISYYNCYLCGEKGGSRNKNAKIDEPEQRRSEIFVNIHITGVSSLEVPGVPWHTQILADQLTLFQPGGQIMPI